MSCDSHSREDSKQWNGIIASGGSTNALSELGAIYRLCSKGRLDITKLTVLAGTSAGYIICILLNIGFEPMEIFDIIYKMEKFFSFDDINSLSMMWSSWSLIPIETLKQKLASIISIKFPEHPPTLRELYEKTSQLVVGVTVNATMGKLEYITHETHPDVSCLDAMLMSAALPWIFSSVTINDVEYVDGGVLDNFPVEYVNKRYPDVRCLGIVLKTIVPTPITSLLERRLRLMFLPINQRTEISIERAVADVLIIEVTSSIIEFRMTSERKMKLFLLGVDAADKFIVVSNDK